MVRILVVVATSISEITGIRPAPAAEHVCMISIFPFKSDGHVEHIQISPQ